MSGNKYYIKLLTNKSDVRMKKNDLVASVSDASGLSKVDAAHAVDCVVLSITYPL